MLCPYLCMFCFEAPILQNITTIDRILFQFSFWFQIFEFVILESREKYKKFQLWKEKKYQSSNSNYDNFIYCMMCALNCVYEYIFTALSNLFIFLWLNFIFFFVLFFFDIAFVCFDTSDKIRCMIFLSVMKYEDHPFILYK